ncbi:hypothetical protein [uncultured Corynebacterium sp.]|uniref:hypothetical protein n=1 Tax=uncultured Corynebacterium sp. TaxID=159447 RepID=UPI0028892172|nr:hypothetical protein [uncultured Corynebacterium sp.]
MDFDVVLGVVSVLTSATVALVALFSNQKWEARKLSRDLRARAYSSFMSAQSDWHGKLQERDRNLDKELEQARKIAEDKSDVRRQQYIDAEAVKDCSREMSALRSEIWSAYSSIKVVGPKKVVRAAAALVNYLDKQNAEFFKEEPSRDGIDVRAKLLNNFVAAAREDLGWPSHEVHLAGTSSAKAKAISDSELETRYESDAYLYSHSVEKPI